MARIVDTHSQYQEDRTALHFEYRRGHWRSQRLSRTPWPDSEHPKVQRPSRMTTESCDVQRRSTATSPTASGSERPQSAADLPQRQPATSVPRVRIEGVRGSIPSTPPRNRRSALRHAIMLACVVRIVRFGSGGVRFRKPILSAPAPCSTSGKSQSAMPSPPPQPSAADP
jgi:hypothetical protein